ncbi:hypothetical protein [Risungbinella massiliensis]|uniref:hypothetical protein n=1 Tax=Risungbinella massiliensis TaxID=1329796 RepID=UPI0005CC3C0C|nr:hypothetical protein [Risungbinella massiliensis]
MPTPIMYVLVSIGDLDKALKEPRNLYRTMQEDATDTEEYAHRMAARLFLNVVDYIRNNPQMYQHFLNGSVDIPFHKVDRYIGRLNDEEIAAINDKYTHFGIPLVLWYY